MKILYSDMKLIIWCERTLEKSIARQRLLKQVSVATNMHTHAKVEKLLGVNFNNDLVMFLLQRIQTKERMHYWVGLSIRSA
jgi:hypothetical protein